MHLYYRTIEIFDLETLDGKLCHDNFPIEVDGAVGGWVGGHPLVCGGTSNAPGLYHDECFIIGDNDNVAVTMNLARGNAASVVCCRP